MDKETAIEQALALADGSGVVMLGTDGDDDILNIKAML